MPGGQPTKFNKEIKRQALLLAAKGFTYEDMAQVFGVKRQTIHNWQKAHPKFFDTLKEIKAQSDTCIEKSLYQKAQGYELNGKHYPADTVSMIFWLKNRQPKKWRDRQEIDFTVGLQGLTDKELDEEVRELAANQGEKGAQTPITKGKDKA